MTTYAVERTKTLTADDVKAIRKALKKARAVCAYHNRNRGDVVIFGEHTKDQNILHSLEVPSVVTDYLRNAWGTHHDAQEGVKAFAYLGVYTHTVSVGETVFRSLRVGDAIRLWWLANNNSEALRNGADHHRDELRLEVFRDGKKVAEHLLDVFVGPYNTARMVQGV